MIKGLLTHRLPAALASGTLLLGLAFAPAGAAPKPAGLKIVAPTGTPITLEVSKGRLIRLDQPASSVFVADPDVADVQVKSPSLVYIFGKAAGETTLYAVGDNDEVLLNSVVQVRHNLGRLQQAIHELVPRSAVSVSTVDDSLVLAGTAFSAADAEDVRRLAARFVPDAKQLINKMQVDAPSEVNIRVRVAEVSRSVTKQLGINWQNIFNNGSIAFGLVTAGATLIQSGGKVNPLQPGSSSVGFNTQNTSLLGGATNNNLFFGARSNFGQVNALIDALENNGLITILAEPNLTALSGEPASFLAGGEFPIPVPQAGTANGVITIEYKKFGVSLNFVATIVGERINLHVQPEVSELSSTGSITIGGVQVPGLNTRRAETTLELGSGQSFAIGGLLQNNISQTVQKFPWLGDVPILGALFRDNAFLRNESELVIIVTPYIVRPVATANALQSPTDGYHPSSDQNQLLNGSTYRPQVQNKNPAPVGRTGTGLIGPAGFDLD